MPDNHIFGTVLVNRKINSCPKEWELQIRSICRKIRVVENLVGGAHLMVTGTPSVAVRIYNAEDTCRFEDATAKADKDLPYVDEEIGGLPYFRDTYEHSIAIFVLPTGQLQRDQLGRRESFVNVAQRALLLNREEGGSDHEKKHISRIAIVSDTSQALRIIDSVVQSLLPEKREKRRVYFAEIADQHFLPSKESQHIQEVIANHATKAFTAWSERFAMPTGDSSVALSVLGSLAHVTTAKRSILKDVPIRNVSKEIIMNFFGVERADIQSYEDDVEHRDNIFYPPGSHSSNIQFQNNNDHNIRGHTRQYTYQRDEGCSYPAQSAPYHSNHFIGP